MSVTLKEGSDSPPLKPGKYELIKRESFSICIVRRVVTLLAEDGEDGTPEVKEHDIRDESETIAAIPVTVDGIPVVLEVAGRHILSEAFDGRAALRGKE